MSAQDIHELNSVRTLSTAKGSSDGEVSAHAVHK